MFQPQILQGLANAGVNFTINGTAYQPQILQALANACAQRNTHLTLRNASQMNPQLLGALANILHNNLTVED